MWYNLYHQFCPCFFLVTVVISLLTTNVMLLLSQYPNGHSCHPSQWPHTSKWPLLALLQQPSSGVGQPLSSHCPSVPNRALHSCPLFHQSPELIIWLAFQSIAVPSLTICHKGRGQKIRWRMQSWAAHQHCSPLQVKTILCHFLLVPWYKSLPQLGYCLRVEEQPPLGSTGWLPVPQNSSIAHMRLMGLTLK